jgi:hypothetical protein
MKKAFDYITIAPSASELNDKRFGGAALPSTASVSVGVPSVATTLRPAPQQRSAQPAAAAAASNQPRSNPNLSQLNTELKRQALGETRPIPAAPSSAPKPAGAISASTHAQNKPINNGFASASKKPLRALPDNLVDLTLD